MNAEELQKLIGQKRTLNGEQYMAIAVTVTILINNSSVQDNREVKTIASINGMVSYNRFSLDSWLNLEEVN